MLTTAATTDPSDPEPPCPIESPNSRGKSVWYRFDATTTGTLVVDTFDSDYDTILSAYTGECGALELIPNGCSDDDPFDGAQSRVYVELAAGTTYGFMVSAFRDDGGTLEFHAALAATPTASRTPVATPTRTATSPTAPTATVMRTSTPGGTRTATTPGTPPPTPTRSQTPSLAGDANCDDRRTAADLIALVRLIGDGSRAPCGRDDANGDGVLTVADIAATIGRLFAP